MIVFLALRITEEKRLISQLVIHLSLLYNSLFFTEGTFVRPVWLDAYY